MARIDLEGLARRVELLCSSGHADPSCPPGDDAARAPDAGEGFASDGGRETEGDVAESAAVDGSKSDAFPR